MNEIRNPSGEVNIEFLTKLQSAMDVNQGMDGEIGESQPNPRAEGIFAAQCILKKRTRKVRASTFLIEQNYNMFLGFNNVLYSAFQGQVEYLVKWKGWSAK